MAIDSVSDLVDAIRYEQVFDEEQLRQLTGEMLARFESPQALARYLIQCNWLTTYQTNHLFEGRPTRLTLGPYCILDRLGEGGVSEVYKAWDRGRNRYVALKVMRQDLASEADAVRQFEREWQAVTRLNHPNIIRTYDAGRTGTARYFAMEFVEGTDLGHVVQLSGALPVGEACEYIRQVATGLQFANTMGLVHRDIKPANLFLIHPPGHSRPTPGVTWKRPSEPVIKIIDWGLARLQTPSGAGDPSDSCGLNREEGMLIGTADYIAPEQARDPRLVDIRADIYSLGCTFYYLLTGQPPFPGSSLMQKLQRHQQEEPVPVRQLRPDLPADLDAVIRKMLAKEPEDRYQVPLSLSVPLRRFCETGNSSSGGARRPAATAVPDDSRLRTPRVAVSGFLRRRS